MPVRPRATERPAPVRAPASRRGPSLRPKSPPRPRPLLFNFAPTLSRAEREQRRTQWVVLLTALTCGLALLIGGVGLFVNVVRKPRLPVAAVEARPITRATWQQYQALLTAELQGRAKDLQTRQPDPTDQSAQLTLQLQLQQIQQQLGQIGDTAVNDLIDQRVVAGAIPKLEQQGAPADQVVPSAKAVDDALAQEKQTLGVGTPDQWRQTLKGFGMDERQVRDILTARLEQDMVKNYLNRDLQPNQQEVKARVMVFGDSAKAGEALQQLRGGKSWDDVNQQYSRDTTAKETSRDVDWVPKGLEDSAFDAFAFGAQPLQLSDVLNANGQSEIMQVIDVAPSRPLTQDQREQLRSKVYSAWLQKQTDEAHVRRFPQNMTA